MKKLFYLLICLILAACGSQKSADISSGASTTTVSKSRVTLQSVLSETDKGRYVQGELLVKFKSGTAKASAQKAHQIAGATVIRSFKIVPNVEHVRLSKGLAVKDAITQYMSNPDVEYAEPNYIRKVASTEVVPNDLYFRDQWSLRNTGQYAYGTAGADIKATEAWRVSTGSYDGSIAIAVLDTGIDYNHSELVGNIWRNLGETNCLDGIDGIDNNGYIDDCKGWDFSTCAKFDVSRVTNTTSLTGAQEVPPVVTSATGTAKLTVNLNITERDISGTLTFSGLSSSATAAYIHQGAAGTKGAAIVTLIGGAGGTSGTWTIPAGTVLTSGQLDALKANGLYFNVDSTTHPEGEIRGQIIFTSSDFTVFDCITTKPTDNDPMDDNGHGTHVAGIIGAKGNNSAGIAGIMWMVKMMPIKVLNADGEGSDADIAAGIQYAVTNHAKVINASFGGYSYSSTLYDAIAAANSAGILLVAAAGNEGVNNDLTPNYPSSYDLPNIIAVAATDQDDRRVPFSNFGPLTVDVAAPGTYIISTVPTWWAGYDGYGYLEQFSGTSMAAPHVTGLAGLLFSYYYNLNSTQIRNMILTYVDILPSLDGWIATKGRINAFRSMSALWEPFDLTLNKVSAYQVNLSWTDIATAESNYIVERKEQGGTYTGLATLGPNVNAYYDSSNIKDGTRYYYRLRLKNWIGESRGVFENERSIITAVNPPTDLTATALSNTQIRLNWVDKSNSESGFKIFRHGNEASFVQVGQTGPNVSTFVDSGLFSATKYWYEVSAYNAVAGDSGPSGTVEVYTLTLSGHKSSGGGGGGCSIGAKQNVPTSFADASVMLLPLLVIAVLRRRR